MHDATRPEALLEFRVLWVVGVLRLLLGVQVIQVPEELVEPVGGGQELVLVTKVILAELTRDITERLEQLGDRRVLGPQTLVGARQPDLGQPGADRRLPGDESGPPGGAALLAIPVSEYRPFSGHAIDVGSAVPHDAQIVGTDVVPPDVVAPEDQDIRFLLLLFCHIVLLLFLVFFLITFAVRKVFPFWLILFTCHQCVASLHWSILLKWIRNFTPSWLRSSPPTISIPIGLTSV